VSIDVRSGPAKIIASGSATAFMGHSVVLDLRYPVELTVEFAFEQRPDIEDVAVELEAREGELRLLCVNFDKADGRGSATPVLLGDTTELLVLLHFRVFRYGNTADRTVHYTVYTVDKRTVDWAPAAPGDPVS
jgi:hypothetical protein